MCDTFVLSYRFSFFFFSPLSFSFFCTDAKRNRLCSRRQYTDKYEKKNDIVTRTRMLIVISDGWPLLLSIKNSSLQSSSNVRECTHTHIGKNNKREREAKRNRKDMQMSSAHIQNVTLDVSTTCVQFFLFRIKYNLKNDKFRRFSYLQSQYLSQLIEQ
jgi:hypothetical protein